MDAARGILRGEDEDENKKLQLHFKLAKTSIYNKQGNENEKEEVPQKPVELSRVVNSMAHSNSSPKTVQRVP
ncbi:uncharacterized protein N7469_002612 [Penicillium citrinum]|uniref:Uncharacterized protein n=2 Tax=Penicillium TaxID=5073 RepID=A0A9W9PAM3_PENCI|nr:uncharacterized protein N7469_002612 [Penicillium citrinum]KAJ5241021.1 hypothetical protein N7469_002612 [Penicillium citrinum]KAJ5586018.1 hypothetical protein N7450_005805 [Penicillium hetheringtonii]